MRQKSRSHCSHRIGIFLMHRTIGIPSNAGKWDISNPLRKADLGQFPGIFECFQLLCDESVITLAFAREQIVINGVCRLIIPQLPQSMSRRHHYRDFNVGKRRLELRDRFVGMHLPQRRCRCRTHFRLRIFQGILCQLPGASIIAKQTEGSNAVRPLSRHLGERRSLQHVPCLVFRTLNVGRGLRQQ